MSYPDFDAFHPEELMLPEEMKAVKRGLSALERHYRKRAANDLLPKDKRASPDALSKLRDVITEQLGQTVSEVLRREIGLEKYMVVRIFRDDGYDKEFQVMALEVMRRFASYQWAWELSGRNVRADGTLGRSTEGNTFREARIERRRLDGSWERLSRKHST